MTTLDLLRHKEKEARRHNSTYTQVAVQWLFESLCSYQRLYLVDSFVLLNRHLRVAATRCTQLGTSGSGSALGLRLEINCDLSRSANRQQKNMKSVEKATKERFQKASAKPWKARFPSDEPTSFLRSYWVEF